MSQIPGSAAGMPFGNDGGGLNDHQRGATETLRNSGKGQHFQRMRQCAKQRCEGKND